MAIRLTKTSKILFAIGIVVLSVALGFLIWRVNQPTQLDPTDSDAFECSDRCYPHNTLKVCTGVGGCRVGNADGTCSGGWDSVTADDNSKWCCDPCKSTATPVKCTFYPNDFKAGQPSCGNKTKDCKAGYYKCDSAGYCVPCNPVDKGDIFTNTTDCQDKADKANGAFGAQCPPGGYRWECKAVYNPDGYILTSNNCLKDQEPIKVDCGLTLEPTSYPFNKANTDGSKIGPFTEDGKLVFFFKNLLDNNAAYRPKITFKVVSTDSSRNNQTYVYKPTAGEERKETTFAVKKGEYLLLTDSNDDYDQGSPECAPTTNNPKYKSFGWIAPSGGSCGSGLQGPPTNGTRTAYDKVDISSFRNNALKQGYKQLPKGEQCWADWREWVGDYDFNDYFLMVSYVTDAPTPTPNISISKAVVEQCIDENTANPKAELTYTITVKNTGGSAGDIDEIEDILDSKVLESFIQKETITKPGVYSDGKITWSGKKNIPANGSAIYTYKLLIDKENFGTYSNTVSLQEAFFCPVGQICAQVMPPLIYASAEIVADCVITETPETPVTPTEGTVPQTGIFDSTASRIVAGFVLLTFGAVIYNLPNSTFTVYKKGKSYKYRDRFEKRVANR